MNPAPFQTDTLTLTLLSLLTLLAAVVAGCSGPDDEPAAAAAEPQAAPAIEAPTVLLITVDTLRADRVGAYGHPDAGTPHMDTLARDGALFESAQTTAPLTLPGHASILTGRSVPAHGVLNNGTFVLPESLPTLAEAARDAGFETGAFVSAEVVARRYGLDRGFGLYDDHVPKLAKKDDGMVVHYPERSAKDTVARTLTWLEDRGDAPALAWVHLWEPHAPYAPPEPFASRHPNDDYQGEVATTDAAIGELLEGVRRLGRGGRLLTVLTSDHGEALGAHGEPTHGVFLYREVLRVPLIVTGPAWNIAPSRHQLPVSVADIAPTLVDLLELPRLEGADGLSLAGLLAGSGPPPERAAVFAESHLPRLEYGWSGLRALVGPETKLIDAPRIELYDRAGDPGEQDNLAPQRPEQVDRAQQRLGRLLEQGREVAPAPADAQRQASQEDLEQLEALGYVTTGRSAAVGALVDPEAADPKDRVDALASFDEAVTQMRSGQPGRAAEVLRGLLEQDPRSPALLRQLGQAQIFAERFAEAEQTFERLVEVSPDFDLAWLRLGQLRGRRGDLEGEQAAYERAVALNPRRMQNHKALASVLMQRKQLRRAIDVLEQARELDPTDPEIREDLERLWSTL
jgi:arylsulfatase A-like enzyme